MRPELESRRRPSHRDAASNTHAANGACTIMHIDGWISSTAIDFIANCIQPLSKKVLLLCVHREWRYAATNDASNGVYSDVLIRSVNSARKWVVYEDNKCIANLKIIGTARFSCSSHNRVIKPEWFAGRSFHGGLKIASQLGIFRLLSSVAVMNLYECSFFHVNR